MVPGSEKLVTRNMNTPKPTAAVPVYLEQDVADEVREVEEPPGGNNEWCRQRETHGAHRTGRSALTYLWMGVR